MRFHETNEADTIVMEGSKTVSHMLIQFRTGKKKNAGTDASVTLQINGWHITCPDMPGNDNEAGSYYTYAFPNPIKMTMDELRAADIWLFHDNSGKKPGWYVENVLIQVALDQPGDIAPDLIQWYTFKLWPNVGWLAEDEAGGRIVQLQVKVRDSVASGLAQ